MFVEIWLDFKLFSPHSIVTNRKNTQITMEFHRDELKTVTELALTGVGSLWPEARAMNALVQIGPLKSGIKWAFRSNGKYDNNNNSNCVVLCNYLMVLCRYTLNARKFLASPVRLIMRWNRKLIIITRIKLLQLLTAGMVRRNRVRASNWLPIAT